MEFARLLAACGNGGKILQIPPWHKYLSGTTDAAGSCNIEFSGLNDIWLVALALLEILLRLSALVAVTFIIWGAIILVTSGGSPERIAQGRNTIWNAVLGLIIAIGSTVIVSFIAGRF